jgi:hypothetical protein
METNNNKDENTQLLIQLVKITEELENTFQYLIPIVYNISNKSHNSTLSQTIKSDVQSLRFIMYDKLNTFKNFKNQFENDLMQICNHEWITDYIDISEYESKKIVYCDKCKLTKQS